jgi:hypothetical protein
MFRRTNRSLRPSLLIAIAGLLGSACFTDDGGTTPRWEGRRSVRYSEVVPSPEDVELRVPGNRSPGALTLGQTARFYADTYRITREVNGTVYVVLSILRDIVRLPPSEQGEDYAIWGPWTPALEPTTFALEVRQVGAADYEYVLRLRPRTSEREEDWVHVLEGAADLSGGEDVEGRGRFVLDFTAYARLNPLVEVQGQMHVDYEHRPLQWRSVEVLFEGLRERRLGSGEPRDVRYRYLESPDTSGEFQFAFLENVHGPLEGRPEPELVQIRSRWSATGAGRADARVSGSEIAAALGLHLGLEQDWVQACECWDDGFLRVWYDETPVRLTDDDGEPLLGTWNGPGQGDAGDCVYEDTLFADDDVTVL